MNRLIRSSSFAACLVAMATCAGCNTADWSASGRDVRLRDDIVAIRQFPATDPWLRDEFGRICGLNARVYFVSAETGKGAFVPRTIHVDLHSLGILPDGTYDRELIYQWEFSEPLIRDLRMWRESVMGQSYGLVMRWPAELDLANREIQLTYRYTRRDGREVIKRSSRFRVPMSVAPHIIHDGEPSSTQSSSSDTKSPADQSSAEPR